MSRADIYEYILYYTERTSEDVRKVCDTPGPKRRAFYTERVEIAMGRIQEHLQQLKTIDKEERKENETI
jgi:hypothetical protein